MAAKLHTIILNKDEDVTAGIHRFLMDKTWKAGRRRRLHL